MTEFVLVTYASRSGSTRGVADAIDQGGHLELPQYPRHDDRLQPPPRAPGAEQPREVECHRRGGVRAHASEASSGRLLSLWG